MKGLKYYVNWLANLRKTPLGKIVYKELSTMPAKKVIEIIDDTDWQVEQERAASIKKKIRSQK